MNPKASDSEKTEISTNHGISTTSKDSPSFNHGSTDEPKAPVDSHATIADTVDPDKTKPNVQHSQGQPIKIEPGIILYSKYHVIKKIGSGNMGDVWLVEHVTLKSKHAFKVITPPKPKNGEDVPKISEISLKRFQVEFQVMAKLRHDNVVAIYDAALDDNGGYIDMEYVQGRTIESILLEAQDRPERDHTKPLMPLEWIERVLNQICDVIDFAQKQERAIVHRDLKPANMMIVGGIDSTVLKLKILDFGIAKVCFDKDNILDVRNIDRKTLDFVGSPAYASPEQCRNLDDIDYRSDIYSVGIMLYEFITGRRPFSGAAMEVVYKHVNPEVTAPAFSEVAPELQSMPEVERCIRRALSKEPSQRQKTALDLYLEFSKAVESDLNILHRDSNHVDAVTPMEVDSNEQKESFSVEADNFDQSGIGDSYNPNSKTRMFYRQSLVIAICIVMLTIYVYMATKPNFSAREMIDVNKKNHRPGPINETIPPWPGTYTPVKTNAEDGIWPAELRRLTDGITFKRFSDGIYLPDGYEIVKSAGVTEGWPNEIKREGVSFIWIAGRDNWTMGTKDSQKIPESSSMPAHQVSSSGFYMQKSEVTNGQIEDYLNHLKRTAPDDFQKLSKSAHIKAWRRAFDNLKQIKYMDTTSRAHKHPAVGLSFEIASDFAKYMKGLLPTEAQWEFAARSRGKEIRFVWGDTPEPSSEWINLSPNLSPLTRDVEVSPHDRTAQGLLHMTGNVREICRDVWNVYCVDRFPVTDPCQEIGDTSKSGHVIRGGGFNSQPSECTTTHRVSYKVEDLTSDDVGFRIVIECPQAAKK